MEIIRRTDCEVETVIGEERVRGVPRNVSLALRARAAVAIVVESFVHPFSNSLITIDPQRGTVSRERSN